MAEHHVDPALGHQVGQRAQVALVAGDQVGDAALLGPAGQDREGVGAGVDDGDLVAELGDPDGETPGAATDVDDPRQPRRRRRRRRGPAQGVPDHGGAGGAAALAGCVALCSVRHGAQP